MKSRKLKTRLRIWQKTRNHKEERNKNSITENTVSKIKSKEEFNSILDAVVEIINDWKTGQKTIQTEA